MNSYNSIKKIQYTSLNEKEPVSLIEYIEFKDDRNEQKYAVLKFKNKITQRLFKISFTVSSYGENDVLLEKNVISYSSLNVNENETFVPNAKLKLDYNTVKISCELDYAQFETCEYKDGEFEHVQYTFDDYIKNNKKDKENKQELKDKQIKKIGNKQGKNIKKQVDKDKAHGYYFKDITQNNKTKKPLFFTIVFALLIGIATFGSVANVSKTARYFSIGDYDYIFLSNDELAIQKYHGKERNLVIPLEVQGRKITQVCKNAFKNNNHIETLVFESIDRYTNMKDGSDIYLDQQSFYGCDRLTSIKSNYRRIHADTYSFARCHNLQVIDAPYAVLNYAALYEDQNLSSITCRNIDTHHINDLFDPTIDRENGLYLQKLYRLSLSEKYKKDYYTFLGNFRYQINIDYHYE